MVLELYVLAPAFGLPSIDAQCIATVAFLQSVLPEHEWALIAAHDESTFPSHTFPALKDGDTWVSGFNNIVRHIKEQGNLIRDPDANLSAREKADSIALTTLLESHAEILLSLYLYTSYTNYSSTTRPAFTQILPWHTNYLLPPARREAARNRTKHLGLDNLDLDTTHDDLSTGVLRPHDRFEAEKRAAGIPSEQGSQSSSILPFGRRKGVLNPEDAARFKLDRLSAKLFDPLDALLGDKAYLLNDEAPTTVDCLALGYLSLMLAAPVPQAWLADTIKLRYPRLEKYTASLRTSIFGIPIQPSTVLIINKLPITARPSGIPTFWKPPHQISLPWIPAPPTATLTTLQCLSSSLLSHVPLLSSYNAPEIIPLAPEPPPTTFQLLTKHVPTLIFGSLGVVFAFAFHSLSIAKRNDDLVFRPEDLPDAESWAAEHGWKRSRRRNSYGAAGDMVRAAFGDGLYADADVQREEERVGGAKVAEVEVEVDVVEKR